MLIYMLSLGCSDYDLHREKNVDPVAPADTSVEIEAPPTSEIEDCDLAVVAAEEIGIGDECPMMPEGGFTPVVEWSYAPGRTCMAMPAVADLDQDGKAEIIANITYGPLSTGSLVALKGDGSGELWVNNGAMLGNGTSVAVGDINGDGSPEIISSREYAAALFAPGDYTAVAWDANGTQIWESEHFTGLDMDWATQPILSDMDGDGEIEIIVGRVILRPDGTTRGVGEHGRGSYGISGLGDFSVSEASSPAVSDLDLDGQQEIIVGNARYDADGNTLFHDPTADDAMIAIADLDNDPEGEVVAVSYNTVRAIDTDGSVMWGPIAFPAPANILSVPAIADIDGDGLPEIVVAGGNIIRALNHDGSTLWESNVVDESGASGASIFDFEGDGIVEVVYSDEGSVMAFDGPTGGLKFFSEEHSSVTMMEYPVVADVDMDGHAEIIVCHSGYTHALSIYGDEDNSWMYARPIWNQHAFSLDNVNEDLTIPSQPTPSFQSTNTWHSAIAEPGVATLANLSVDILDICTDDCDIGSLWLSFRVLNRGDTDVGAGVPLALYATTPQGSINIAQFSLPTNLPAGWASESIDVGLETSLIEEAQDITVSVDDNGSGIGLILECTESDNKEWRQGPFCE